MSYLIRQIDFTAIFFSDIRQNLGRLAGSRGYNGDKISQIMARQLSEEKFRECCDFVIDNSGSFQDSCSQVDRRLQNILKSSVY